MAIAPTSSISILVGTTQAIEPVYKKKWYEENLSGLIPVVVPNLSPETYQYYPSAYEVDQLDIIKAAATDTFNESSSERIGILTNLSANFRSAFCMPSSSLPTNTTQGMVYFS